MANKGPNFERDIAKYLTKLFTGKEKPYVFWRSPSSGAMATLSEENKELSGDIHSLRPEGACLTDKYSIELKTGYPDASFDKHLKDNKNNIIEDFWSQCCRDAYKAKKKPLLIFRKRGFKPWAGISYDNKINRDIKIKYYTNLKTITLSFGNNNLSDLIFYDMEELLPFIKIEVTNNI